jgi:hypothetical protein
MHADLVRESMKRTRSAFVGVFVIAAVFAADMARAMPSTVPTNAYGVEPDALRLSELGRP